MFDILFGVVFVVIMIFALLMGRMIINEISDAGIFSSSVVGNQTMTDTKLALGFLDANMLLFIVIGVGGATIISAFMARSHPIFFIALLFMNIIMWVILAPLSNALTDVMGSSGIAGTTNYVPISYLIIQWLPLISIILGFILAIVVALPRGE